MTRKSNLTQPRPSTGLKNVRPIFSYWHFICSLPYYVFLRSPLFSYRKSPFPLYSFSRVFACSASVPFGVRSCPLRLVVRFLFVPFTSRFVSNASRRAVSFRFHKTKNIIPIVSIASHYFSLHFRLI